MHIFTIEEKLWGHIYDTGVKPVTLMLRLQELTVLKRGVKIWKWVW